MRCIPLILIGASLIAATTSAKDYEMINGYGRRYDVETQIDRGIIKFAEGNRAAARERFDKAIQLDPNAWPAYYDRAILSSAEKKWNLVIKDLSESIRINPSYLPAILMRSETNRDLGNYAAALADLNNMSTFAIRLAGEEGWNNRAWIYATAHDPAYRNGRLAVADATKACNLTGWKSPYSLDTLAAAYCESGDFASAAKYERQAMDILTKWLPTAGKHTAYFTEHREKFSKRLALYEQHKRPSFE